jgi:hypothetical protein
MHVAPLALHEWHEFYLLLGTVAGALVALLFVAVSVGVGYLTEGRSTATRFFLSPIVVHFSSVLMISALALAPEKIPLLIETLIGLNAAAGFIVSCVVFIRVLRSHFPGVVAIDHFGYGLAPMFSYVVIFIATISAARGWEWSPFLLATGVVLLLFVNIRNAWDMMLALVRRSSEARGES